MKILIIGDVHGRFDRLYRLTKSVKSDIILQCGDFGFWPGHVNFDSLYRIDRPLYWCDGNHEDHWALGDLVVPNDILPSTCHFVKRGSVLTFAGKDFLFMGGARSIDQHVRRHGIDWFPEEMITESDMWKLPEPNKDRPIFAVISHTCPRTWKHKIPNLISNFHDQCEFALENILVEYAPEYWFHGHFHQTVTGVHLNTKWSCLADIESSDCPYFLLDIPE